MRSAYRPPSIDRATLARIAAAIVASFGGSGCGEETAVAGAGDDAVAGQPDAGTVVATDAADATAADTAPDVARTTDAGQGTDASSDGGGGDTAGACPGAPGCTCKEAKDCDNGVCLPTAKGQVCAKKCSKDECAADEKCVQAGAVDVVNVCVPKFAFLCNPCNANPVCQNQANADARCVDGGNNGAFCGTACATDNECPAGYSCGDVKDISGTPSKQCVPKGGAACACTSFAIDQQLSTKCFVPTGDGKCEGKRTCLPAGAAGAPAGGGLSACLAPDVQPETCNGKDDDCDGQVDEATCSDGNPCTDDVCKGAGGCQNPNGGTTCDADGSVCTEGDKCVDGKCIAGKLVDCDDKNPCTKDSCDPKAGCQKVNDDGATCNADDNPCTISDQCAAGKCEAGKAKACTNDDPCMVGKCDIGDGSCKYKFQANAPCNDGNACTDKEVCVTDACTGQPVSCDDKNTCTSDFCDPKSGCAHNNVAGACDDGDKCSEKDACDAGACKGAKVDAATFCDDTNPCTTDTCDAVKGCQQAAASGAKCDDGNPCTDSDACKDGKCSSDINNCACQADSDCKDDGNLCNGTLFCDKVKQPFVCKVKESTIVACDASLNGECQTNTCDPTTGKCGFAKKPDFLPCDADKSLCTVGDVCKDGKCAPGTVQACDDKNVCTDDSCDPTKGCVFTPNKAPCNADDNACSENDACAQGACVAGKAKSCDPGDPCVIGKCSIIGGKCTYNFQEGATCNDANPCTVPDTCKVDACTGPPANCDDNNPCTGDACDTKVGCTHIAIPASCSDGDKCTAGDACKDGKCGGAPIDVVKTCDDDNVCTTDGCDPAAGCTHKGTTGGVCDDGNACTKGDACDKGVCVAGTSQCTCQTDADCKDDGNLCNGVLYCDKSTASFQCKIKLDSIVTCDPALNTACASVDCDPKAGKCVVTNAADGVPCNADNNACTDSDACKGGKCAAGAIKVCDDKNACTDDSCDPKSGCKFANNASPCDADNNQCTQADKCASGACAAGVAKKCDDGEPCTQDTCEAKSGQCLYTPIQTTCSDNNICTTGDVCGADKAGVFTCLPGKPVSCDDTNPCTIDQCDATKGCTYVIDSGASESCYGGPAGTAGKGICKAGKKTCDAKGVLGPCQGDVGPAAKDLCNGIDDTCDGVTDEGCAPTGFAARVANGVVSGKSGQLGVRAALGASLTAGATGGSQNPTARLGFYAWLKKIVGL